MTSIHSPRYVFRDNEEPTAYQIWIGEESAIIHEDCARTLGDCEFPLYPDDVEAMRNQEPIDCYVCSKEVAKPL